MKRERYLLSRDARRGLTEPPPEKPPPPAPTELASLKTAYLQILSEFEGDMARAMQAVKFGYGRLRGARSRDASFAAAEKRIVGLAGIDWHKQAYLLALELHYTNETKACRDAGIPKSEITEWMKDEAFAAARNAVLGAIVDNGREQVARVLSGARSTVKDWGTFRWGLAKIDPDFADKPTQIMHINSGGSLQSIEERIKQLEAPDEADQG